MRVGAADVLQDAVDQELREAVLCVEQYQLVAVDKARDVETGAGETGAKRRT